jgi:hypothetical protein
VLDRLRSVVSGIDATVSGDGAVHLRDPDGHALSLAPAS